MRRLFHTKGYSTLTNEPCKETSFSTSALARERKSKVSLLWLASRIVLPRRCLRIYMVSVRFRRSHSCRIGKALSPSLAKRLRKSAYREIKNNYGEKLARRLWMTWREGRNLVFHYFPHNYRSLTREEAEILTKEIVGTMQTAVERTQVLEKKKN